MRNRLHLWHGDCLVRMAALEGGSVDAVVCDPPYNLTPTGSSNPGRRYWAYFGDSGRQDAVPEGNQRRTRRPGFTPKGFLGLEWDGSDIAISPEFWTQVFRVLRTDGIVKAFGGSRTFHRMGYAMAKAGLTDINLEAWGYGSGFPKSYNISKALDREAGKHLYFDAVRDHLRKWRDERGLDNKDLNVIVGSSNTGSGMAGHWTGHHTTQPEIPSKEQWTRLKEGLGWPDCDLDAIYSFVKDGAERPGTGEMRLLTESGFFAGNPGESVGYSLVETTANATEAAEFWAGWGTALKPSWEPVLAARKGEP